MKPRDAKTLEQILKLESDGFQTEPDRWLIILGEDGVSLHPPYLTWKDYITIPREDFDAIIDWYNKNQKTKTK